MMILVLAANDYGEVLKKCSVIDTGTTAEAHFRWL